MDFVIAWLTDHPEYSGWIVFLITFTETFAFIGALAPGVVILFAASALIGSTGAMSLLPLMIIVGIATSVSNSISFAWGYALRHRVEQIPFFVRHQRFLQHSEKFFNRWGAISVMGGRFIGPIRPFIAFVAGTLSYSPRRFILFDSLAILIWVPVYVLPGYLTGVAVDDFIPDIKTWPPLYLISLFSTLIMLGFLAGNYWLQFDTPHVNKIARKLHMDELPLASVFLLILSICLWIIPDYPLPLDKPLTRGFEQVMGTWGLWLSDIIIRLSDQKLLLIQSVTMAGLVGLRGYRGHALVMVLAITAGIILQQFLSDNISDRMFLYTGLLGVVSAMLAEAVKPNARWLVYFIPLALIFIQGMALLSVNLANLTGVILGTLAGASLSAIARILMAFKRQTLFTITQLGRPGTYWLIAATISYLWLGI